MQCYKLNKIFIFNNRLLSHFQNSRDFIHEGLSQRLSLYTFNQKMQYVTMFLRNEELIDYHSYVQPEEIGYSSLQRRSKLSSSFMSHLRSASAKPCRCRLVPPRRCDCR